jgi:Uma2 family endonuclease
MATTTWNATVDDLYKVEGKAELVDGELVLMHGSGYQHGVATGNIFSSLRVHVKKRGVGVAFGDNIVFLCDLPNRKSFSPDCCYYTGPNSGKKFAPQPPVFAIEVRGQEDEGATAERRMKRKRADYFAAGTQVVWDVLPDVHEIHAYRAGDPENPTVFAVGDQADAAPAVPGWRFPVDELLS